MRKISIKIDFLISSNERVGYFIFFLIYGEGSGHSVYTGKVELNQFSKGVDCTWRSVMDGIPNVVIEVSSGLLLPSERVQNSIFPCKYQHHGGVYYMMRQDPHKWLHKCLVCVQYNMCKIQIPSIRQINKFSFLRQCLILPSSHHHY